MKIGIFLMSVNSLIIIFYVFLDLYYREEISILSSSIKVRYGDYIWGIFLLISKKVNNSSIFLSQEAQKSIKYFYPLKYNKFYETVFISTKTALSFLIIILFNFISAFLGNFLISSIGIAFSIMMFILLDSLQANKYRQVKNDINLSLPNLLTKLSLLIDSGINYRSSIEIIVEKGQGTLYKELRLVKNLIDNGKDETEAYMSLAKISEDILVKKFISLIIQNIYKGSEDFSKSLKDLKRESLIQKKNYILEQSQKASQKLLFPNLLIFLGIMIMVMVPILLSAF